MGIDPPHQLHHFLDRHIADLHHLRSDRSRVLCGCLDYEQPVAHPIESQRKDLKSGVDRRDVVEPDERVVVAGHGRQLGQTNVELGVGEVGNLRPQRGHSRGVGGRADLRVEVQAQLRQLRADKFEVGQAAGGVRRLRPQEFGRQKEQGAPFMHAIFLIMSREQSGTMSGAATSQVSGRITHHSDTAGIRPSRAI